MTVHLLPIRSENSNAVGYVCTMPEEGLAQLEVLKQLGCKPHHRVLEIGCGALVAGFPTMQYLEPGHYAGIDPNGWLTESSLTVPDVFAVVREKRPRFFQSSNFRTGTGEKFDFILSHSILSHASNAQMTDFLAAAAEQLAPGGILAASLRLAEGNEVGSPGSALHGADFTEWQYPGVSWFQREDVLARARGAGFSAGIDPELTRTIRGGNPKAIHDWLSARRAPRVMLGVPCFMEDPGLLARALASFAEDDVHVVAIDNGATPETKTVLETMRVGSTVIHHPENIYVNPAWNELAVRFLDSPAEVLVLANADLVVGPGWSRALLLHVDIVSGRREFWRGRGVDTEADVCSLHDRAPSGDVSDDPRHTAGAFFALSREAVRIAFPIPSELKLWYGDTWIETVLAEAGFAAVTLRDVLAFHAGKVSSNQLPELAEMVAREGTLWETELRERAQTEGWNRFAAQNQTTPEPPPVLFDGRYANDFTGKSNVTLVTAFFRLRDRSIDEDEAFRRFDTLAACGLPILLFLDRRMADLAPKQPNVRVELTDLETLWPFEQDAAHEKPLPKIRTPDKDTRDFLLLQNAKLDLLALAKKLDDSATHFAWIDFGIMKVAKDPELFLERLRALSPPPSCVLAPGCWSKEQSAFPNAGVNWRFCGGFLLVNRESVPALVERYHDVFRRARELAWEVNVWAQMERRGQRFDWYQADHDDSILGGRSGMPRVCLNMIVKNEGAIIERCLAAALPFIDTWVIADTGSTDDTPARIERFFAAHKVPGTIVRATFKDFAQARNEALDAALAVPGWDYALLIDADMMMAGSLDKRALKAPGYKLLQKQGSLEYWNPRLWRRDAPAGRYVGVTHEFLSVDGVQDLHGLFIDDQNDGGSKSNKGERDIQLLNDGLAKEPQNARYMYYLAQTYRDNGRPHEAIQWHRRHIAQGSWDEEVWASYYGIAKAYRDLGNESELVKACLDAYNYRPSRGESLKILARFYRERGKNVAALLIAEALKAIPYPGDFLFVERDVYEFGADQEIAIAGYWVGGARREAGYQACARLTVCRDATVRNEARGNFIHYARSATDLFGAEIRGIDWRPEDGYAPMNPSVCIGSDGGRLVLVRTVNYTVADGQYPTTDGSGIIRTHNHIVTFDEDWKVVGSTEIVSAPSLPARKLGFVEGYEDCRLWHDGSRLYASATVRDSPDSDGRCEMAILTLVKTMDPIDGRKPTEWHVTAVDEVRDYEHDKPQKNWMPIIGSPGYFLYLCDPTIVVERTAERRTVEHVRHAAPDHLGELRGGSQLVPHGEGWLCLTHEVVWNPGRIYLHRFVMFDAGFQVVSLTEPFYFAHKGIEFAAGLARDGEKLVASFGVNDASAHLAMFDVEKVEQRLRPITSQA